MENEEKIKAVEKALGEPFGLAYDENTLKTRRNLLIAGSIGVLFWHAGLKVEPASADLQSVSLIFGMTVKGITHKTFLYGLQVATIYLLCHFLWSSIDGINEFRLRATGTKVAHQTGMKWGSEENDYPSDPRQSTLYNWWFQQSRGLQLAPVDFKTLQEQFASANKTLQELVKTQPDAASQNLHNAIHATQQVNTQLADLTTKIERFCTLLQNDRIPVSLKRFDKAFKFHSVSQNARWFILDFSFPMLVGVLGFASTTAMILAIKSA